MAHIEVNSSEAPQRRFKIHHDILLLEQVQHVNPYAADDKPKAWKEVVDTLNDAKVFEKALDERAVKDRLSYLVTAHQSADIRNRVKSGKEEQYEKMEILLEDISCMVKSAAEENQQRKRKRQEQMDEKRKQGKYMQQVGEFGKKAPVTSIDATVQDGETSTEKTPKEPAADQKNEEDRRRGSIEGSIDLCISPSSSKSSTRSSRNANKDKSVDIELQWMALMREMDEKTLQFKEKKAAGTKEIRMQELEVEKLRLKVEEKKWEAMAVRGSGFSFDL